MITHSLKRSVLLLFFYFISFQSFCQFGEKQVIHEDDGEQPEYRFIGAYDFDNDLQRDLWYIKNVSGENEENAFFKLEASEYIEINTPSPITWFRTSSHKIFDYDNDGLNDIVYVQDGIIRSLRNEQDFNFSEPVSLITEHYFVENFSSYDPIDIDEDGMLDLISMDVNEVIVWARNEGNGNFAEPQTLLDDESRFIYPRLSAYDINKDGSEEIFVPSFDIIEVFTKVNDEYEPLQTLELPISAEEYLFSDINNDGTDDLLILGDGLEGLYLIYFLNDGERFAERTDLFFGELGFPNYVKNLKTGDLDYDGDNDFLVDIFGISAPTDPDSGNKWFVGTAWIENIDSFSDTEIHYQFNFNWSWNYQDRQIEDKYALDLYNNGTIDIPISHQVNWIEINDLNNNDYRIFSLKNEYHIGETYELKTFKNRNGDIEIVGSFDNQFMLLSNLFEEASYTTINIHSVEKDGYLDVVDFDEDGFTDIITSYEEVIGTDDLGAIFGIYRNRPDLDYFTIEQEIQYRNVYAYSYIESKLINGDSSPDIITSSGYVDHALYLENVDDGFQEKTSLPYTYDILDRTSNEPAKALTREGIYEFNESQFQKISEIRGVQFVDLDGDGDQDILGYDDPFQFTQPVKLYWHEDLGGGDYSAKTPIDLIYNHDYYFKKNLFIDLDLDHDADFISSSNDSLYWQENLDGKDQFSEKKLLDNISASVVTSADMDDDGDQDLLIGGNGFIYWYENQTLDSNTPSFSLNLSATEALQGDVVEIPVKAGDYEALQSLSFSIGWDNEIASFEEIVQFGLEGMSQESFVTDETTEGRLGFNWSLEEGTDLSDDKTIFVLKLKLNGDETQSTNLEINNEPVNIQARNASGQIISIESTAGTLTINESVAPNDITLSSTEIEENQAAGTLIGNFFSKDEDNTEGFTYTFAEGEDDEDNDFFEIENVNQLLSAEAFDFEEKEAYTIRIQTTDSRGKSFQKAFTITVTDLDEVTNAAPTAIALSATSIDEHLEAGTLIGTLSTTDEDEEDEHTYRLVEGEGSSGNDFFTIRNNELLSLEEFDFEEQESYNIRILTDDGKGGRFSGSFEITINDVDEVVNEDPTDIALSNQNIEENKAGGTLIGELSTTDPDTGDGHTYSLVTGAGSEGNDFFVIKNNQLISLVSFDYEQLKQTSVRIETNDSKGGTFQKSFTILIEDVEDDENVAPTDIALSNSSIDENAPASTLVGELSATDEDDTEFIFTLVNGSGSDNNGSFRIEGNELFTTESFDYELRDRYTIRIKADDGKGGTLAKQFLINVNDLEDNTNRFPTGISLSNQSIDENKETGTLIGEFSTDDQDEGDSHTYKLLESDDYAFFAIEGDELISNAVFDYEARNTFVIKVQTDDGRGGTFSQAFVIKVTDVENEAPAEIRLSNASIEENKPKGSLVGALSVAGTDTFVFELVSGDGDDDNGLFAITNDELLTDEVFNYETKTSYSIRIRASGEEGENIEQIFTVSILDVNDNTAPEVENFIADQTLAVDEAFSFIIPANTFTDEDDGDQLTYTATLGNGDPLPEWLAFDASTRTLSGTPEANGNITIRIIATDEQGSTASDEFTLIVEGVTAVGEELSKLYKIYPNPTASFLLIEKQDKGDLIQYCRIIDHTGRIVKEWEIKAVADMQIDMNALKSGAYVLELVSANETLRTQILKK